MNAPYRLNAEELNQFARDGYCKRLRVFDAQEVADLTRALQAVTQRAQRWAPDGKTYLLDGKRFIDAGHWTLQFEHQTDSEELRVIEPVYDLDPRFDALIDDPRLVQPMQQLVGSQQLALWTAKANLKPPRTGSGFGWHQDSPYWLHDNRDVDRLPNVYIALDDANEGNGCLSVIRGSHRQGCLPGTSDGSQLGGFFTNPDYYNLEDRVPLDMSAGSVAFFSPHLVHGSAANPTDRPRRALIYTYQRGGAKALKSGAVRDVQAAACAAIDHLATTPRPDTTSNRS